MIKFLFHFAVRYNPIFKQAFEKYKIRQIDFDNQQEASELVKNGNYYFILGNTIFLTLDEYLYKQIDLSNSTNELWLNVLADLDRYAFDFDKYAYETIFHAYKDGYNNRQIHFVELEDLK